MTITEFLLARIAEDEAVAVDRKRTDWRESARFNPLRVLAECEAKRQIVDLAIEGFEYNPNPTLRYLAQVHADHPDYREEWRP